MRSQNDGSRSGMNRLIHVDKTSDYSRGNGDTEEEASASLMEPTEDDAGY